MILATVGTTKVLNREETHIDLHLRKRQSGQMATRLLAPPKIE